MRMTLAWSICGKRFEWRSDLNEHCRDIIDSVGFVWFGMIWYGLVKDEDDSELEYLGKEV